MKRMYPIICTWLNKHSVYDFLNLYYENYVEFQLLEDLDLFLFMSV